jgi:asparagine synthase (glutamine-hydrolysing)
MCGICGKIGNPSVERDEIVRMISALEHRGPDDKGLYLNGGVGLGHARLSIIDLNTGKQPIGNEDGTVWVVFNGEIYNYQKLRQALQEKGHRFSTQTDTETIVHAYEEYGESFVERLEGMFAFALWDQARAKLILGRDRIGQKPLFYAQTASGFIFASEIKALLADGEGPAGLDVHAMHHYLSLRYVPGSYTMFSGIKKLPPAHYLVLEKGKLRIERYWSLSYLPKFEYPHEDLLGLLKEKLRDAVSSHLVSDVPVGSFLSGGLDSPLVAALASLVSPGAIQTFSMGIDQQGFNELPFARQVADRYGTVHHEWIVRPDILGTLPDLIWHLDEPSDPLATCMYSISRLTRQHVKVVLGGDGGDELFGGYERYWGNEILGTYSLIPRMIRKQIFARVIRLLPEGHAYKSLAQKLQWMNTLSFYEGAPRYAQSMIFPWFDHEAKRSLYAESWRNKLEGEASSEYVVEFYDGARTDETVDRMMYADLCTRLPEHSLMILDRTAMAFGLEGRSPYLDHNLVEFAARIPTSMKIKGRNLRYIQKEVAREFLPRELLNREKQGFSTALPYWLKKTLREPLSRLLSASHLCQDGYFRQQGVDAVIREHYQGGVDHSNRLWMLLNLEIWYRMKIQGIKRDALKESILSG